MASGKILQFRFKGVWHLGKDHAEVLKNVKNYLFSIGEEYDKDQLSDLELKVKTRSHYPDLSPTKEDTYSEPSAATGGKTSLTMAEAVSGGAAFIKAVVGECVSQDEINRRAGICTGNRCPRLNSVSNCRACGFAGKALQFVNKIKKSIFKVDFIVPNNMEDKFCDSCGCSLAMMLPSKTSSFQYEHDKLDRPLYCWVRKDSPNFISKE